MTWQDLLNGQKVRVHKTSSQEIHDLRAVVKRDLADSKIDGLSDDRRFATAYNAVLQLTKIVIACEGYRVVGLGHYQTAFQALELALGPSAVLFSAYFEQCRRHRNQVDYDMANVVTEADAELLIQKAKDFQRLVEGWIRSRHPSYTI
jgi:uncharacterized protein (UPF0332 family)